MRRVLTVAAVVIALGAAVGGGVAIGMVVGQDTEPDQPERITETEHDRLLDTCMAQTSQPVTCPGYLSAMVDAADAAGCGYVEAAELMEWEFDHASATRQGRVRAAERILDCGPNG